MSHTNSLSPHRLSLTTFLALVFVSSTVLADCSDRPIPPEALQQPQLSNDQMSELDVEMQTYLEEMENRIACLDSEIASLAPDNATDSFFETSEYQAGFEALRDLIELAESQRQLVLERQTYLLKHTATQ